MLKKIWQSLVRWFRKLSKQGADRSINRVSTAELPPLDDTDREYLFMQLLEGVAHGWQQPRAVGFFNKIRQRVRKSEWLEWLDRFGNNLIQAPVPNYELAGRMVQLAELDCGEIGDLAGSYGSRLLNRQAEEFSDLLPIMEFDALGSGANSSFDQFPEIPAELLIDNDPMESPPSQSFGSYSDDENAPSETREISLEEFSAMLHKDPSLVAELAEQFGVETTDPQEIVDIVIAQMQQQVQPPSGDLNPVVSSAYFGSAQYEPLTDQNQPVSEQSQIEDPTSPVVSEQSRTELPPPPPAPKLEYKPEDPWSADQAANHSEEILPEAVNMPDRGV
ncbi:MAG: hypothetical protein LH474_11875 [Chamaesiphon sp.]|nr:hypothetical protein [Chamaesiphon sp.]